MDKRFIKDLRRGDQVSAVYLVETANFKQGRNGKAFIQMVLRDRTASVKGLRWESNQNEFRQIERNPFLQVRGRVEEFQGALQIVVDELAAMSPEDAAVDPTDFLPHSKTPIPELEAKFQALVESITCPDVRKLVNAVLDRPGLRKRLSSAPAGKVMHHAYIGGLLEHVVSLGGLAQMVSAHYPWIDGSILMAGVLLHDIAKTEELYYDSGFGYTDEGQLVGHIVMGVMWIEEAAKAHPDIDRDKVLEVKHLVASHHGKLEYGSPKTPMTAEASALHFLDNLDARLAAFEQSYNDAQLAPDARERWGDFNHMLGTRLYFPRRMDHHKEPG